MKLRLLFSAIALTVVSTNVYAQHMHSDVELGYDDLANPTAFDIESSNFTSDGVMYFESEMESLDPFNAANLSSDEPGFTTSAAESLLVNQGDQIWLNVVDASAHSTFGVGFVNYYNPLTDRLEAAGRIGIYDNSAGTTDLLLNGASIESGLSPQFIGLAGAGGDIHDHVIIDLLDDATAPAGAYGVMFQLQSDFAAADGTMDLTSDPFWIVFNNGMDEADFDTAALASFGVAAVPEPGSASLIGLGMALMLLRRNKKQLV